LKWTIADCRICWSEASSIFQNH